MSFSLPKRPGFEYVGQVRALNDTQRQAVLSSLAEMQLAQGLLAELVARENVSLSTIHTLLLTQENHLAQLSDALGVEIDSAVAKAQRSADLRAANLRIRELEQQMGKAFEPGQVQPAVRILCENIRAWWALDGLGHVKEVSVHAGGMSATLDCTSSLFVTRRYLKNMFPRHGGLSREQWTQLLQASGFEGFTEDDELCVLATSENQAALHSLISQALPSARVQSTELGYLHDHESKVTYLQKVEIHIPALEDVAKLPERTGLRFRV